MAPQLRIGETPEGAASNSRRMARKVGINLMKTHTGATNHQIGEQFGNMGTSAVDKTSRRLSKQIEDDEAMQKKIKTLQEQLSIVGGCCAINLKR